ncbi:MAG: hypothetical protein DYH12_09440 [Sorangiineae bacterium PRO1]|nr:hypothetical protein [Sorangiineae bacterium PRO1]
MFRHCLPAAQSTWVLHSSSQLPSLQTSGAVHSLFSLQGAPVSRLTSLPASGTTPPVVQRLSTQLCPIEQSLLPLHWSLQNPPMHTSGSLQSLLYSHG